MISKKQTNSDIKTAHESIDLHNPNELLATKETGVQEQENSQHLLKFFEQFGDRAEATFLKIAPVYLTQLQKNIVLLQQASEEQDIDKLQFIAHSMKGEANTFGFHEFSEVCLQLEKSKSLEKAKQHLQTCLSLAGSVSDSLQGKLDELS